MKQLFQKGLVIVTLLFVTSCNSTTPAPTFTPIVENSPTLPSIVFTATSTISNPTVTATPTIAGTPYAPVSHGTPIPLLYKQITPETAPSISLIAGWKTKLGLENLAFLSNRDVVCAGNKDRIESWDIFSGEITSVSDLCGKPFVKDMDERKVISLDNHFSADISTSKYIGGDLTVFDLLRPSVNLYYYLDDTTAVGFSSDGKYLAVGFKDGSVWFVSSWRNRLLDLEDGHAFYDDNLQPEVKIHVGRPPTKIIFSPDDSLLAFLFQDQTIAVWNVATLAPQATLRLPVSPTSQSGGEAPNELLNPENQGKVTRIAIAPNNLILATASTDHNIRIWDTQTGKLLAQLKNGTLNNVLAFSPSSRLLASITNRDSVFIWGILPDNLETASVESTAVAMMALTPISTFSSFPDPTSTPTSSLPSYRQSFPVVWPFPNPTDEQIADARNCKIERLAKTRYPESMNYWELEKAYTPETSCDWAILAFAYRSHLENKDQTPEEGKIAFSQAILENPAFALATPLFYSYFNTMELVQAPYFTKQSITSATIDYDWSGIGEPSNVRYHIEINKANLSNGKVKVAVDANPSSLKENLTDSLDSESVQKIGRALTDFLPVQSQFTMQNCTDNYSDWMVELKFVDGLALTLKTNQSNFFNAGGPWFMRVNDQNYIQYSSALVTAVTDLFDALNLPLGQPYAMFCEEVETFELAFP